MRIVSLSLTAAAMAASFAAGFGLDHQRKGSPIPQRCEPSAPTMPAEAPTTPALRQDDALALSILRLAAAQPRDQSDPSSWDSLLSRLTDSSNPDGTREAFESLVDLAKRDPKVLDELIRVFESTRDPDSKAMLKSLLSRIGGPAVHSYSMRLATSSDAAERREGFDLLHRQSSQSPEVRQLLKSALTKEADPLALFHAVSALQPTVVAPSEAKEVTGLLRGLAQHPDPVVRRQSIMTLAQWDGSPEFIAPLRQALTDDAQEVRQAAIWAAAEAGNRSEPVKAALLTVAYNDRENAEIRRSALHALERFQLSNEEYASYSQVQSHLAEGPPSSDMP